MKELFQTSLTYNQIKHYIATWDDILQRSEDSSVRELAIRRIEELNSRLLKGDY